MKELEIKELVTWINQSFDTLLFRLVSQAEIEKCASVLADFSLFDHYCHLHFPNKTLVLAMEHTGLQSRILNEYETKKVEAMHLLVSKEQLPGSDHHLCITILLPQEQFLEAFSSESRADFMQLLDQAQKEFFPQVLLRRAKEPHTLQLSFVCEAVARQNVGSHLLQRLYQSGIKVGQFHLGYMGHMCLIDCDLFGWEAIDIKALSQELGMLRHFAYTDLFSRSYEREGQILYFLRSVSLFVHQILVHENRYMYTLENITEAFCVWPEIGMRLFEFFRCKFSPEGSRQGQQEARQQLLERIDKLHTGKEHIDHLRRTVLLRAVAFVDVCLKTNFFASQKGAISYRLEASIFESTSSFLKEKFPQLPFAIFYIYQKDFFGFHIRFQDLARGGLRTVVPPSQERQQQEQPFILHECYQLARTQHMKNKDIPEGGAKGIIFCQANEGAGEALHRAQRLFIKSLIQIVNCDGDGKLRAPGLIDSYGKPEYLSFGPDENMHAMMIEWIVAYVKSVGYGPGSACITSKPKTGINHKRYGVTSYGMAVCLEEVLRFLHKEPHQQAFTVKMVGGPDGDVAGNLLLNLRKNYPQTARVLGVMDISGVIYDPKGLDLCKLEELFGQTKAIRYYPVELLAEEGFLLDAKTEKKDALQNSCFLLKKKQGGQVVEEWLGARDAHLLLKSFIHNLPTDVFIPAGGRPASLNLLNIGDFLDAVGRPTSNAIIEGANLYLTQEARDILEEKGVIIIKDSSANKGGVICSSFEVLTSLTMTDEEFIASKEQIVEEILQKIETYARQEVQLILHTHQQTKKTCSHISEAISVRMLDFSEQIRRYFDSASAIEAPYMACFFEYVLPLLSEKFADQLVRSIPEVHKKAIIASWITSKVVYNRGLEWSPTIVDLLPFLCRDPQITKCLYPLPGEERWL